jgi:hypothetical protein
VQPAAHLPTGHIAVSPVPTSALEHMALLGTGALPAPALLRLGERDVPAYVDALLGDKRFARKIAAAILMPRSHPAAPAFPPSFVLKQTSGRVHYLRAPCSNAQAEWVRPYWDLSHAVRVCPDSHQPTHFVSPDHPEWRCGGTMLWPGRSTFCGCGPNLINCTRDMAHRAEMLGAARAEMIETVADVVERDAPIESIYTGNSTIRDRNAEFLYRRWRINDSEAVPLDDLASWTTHRAPRVESVPGQHSGLLTAPQLVYVANTTRGRLRDYYDVLWCAGTASQGADAHTLLELGEADLRTEGWQKLAVIPVCTGCHARMDYGMQFFDGFPHGSHRVNYVRRPHPGVQAPLYGTSVLDLRGRAEQSPRGFAELALAQPEFAACVVQRAAEHVFGGEAPPAVVREMHGAFAERHSLRELVRVALLRYGDRARTSTLPAWQAQTVLPPGQPGADAIALPADVREQVSRHCVRCHSDAPRDLRGRVLARQTVLRMLFAVAGRDMPRTREGLREDERHALALGLAALLWPEGGGRAQAVAFVAEQWRTLPALNADARASMIAARAQHESVGRPITDGHDDEGLHEAVRSAPLTATMLMAASLHAMRDCAAAPAQAHADCLHRALAPEDLVNAPLR